MTRKGVRDLLLHPLSPSPRKHACERAGAAAATTFQEALMEDSMASAEQLIQRWDPEGSDYARITSLFHESPDEAARFTRAVLDLHRDMFSFSGTHPNSPILARAHRLMNTAMNRLHKEFYQILAANRDRLYSDSVVSSTRSSASTSSSDATEETDETFDTAATSVCIEDEEHDENSVRAQSAAAAYGTVDPAQRLPLAVMASLRSIAQCMVSTGYTYECVEAYKSARSSVVQEGLARIGFDLSVAAVPAAGISRDSTVLLDRRVAAWIAAAPAAIRTLFAGERRLADFVFGNDGNSYDTKTGSPGARPMNESCFAVIARDAAVAFLAFPERVAAGILKGTTGGAGYKRPVPDTIFGILDMYNALADLWPEIDSVFSYHSTSDVLTQLVDSILKLGEAVRAMLIGLEHFIQRNETKVPLPGGGIHPLTKYVMDYVVYLADYYSTALAEIYADCPFQTRKPDADFRSSIIYNSSLPSTVQSSPYPEREEESHCSRSPSPSFAASPCPSFSNNVSPRLAWLLLLLLCKLDEKAKLYRDAALSYLFLANNLRYMIARVRGSRQLPHFLGREWEASHEHKAGSFFRSFHRLAWNSVAASIPADAGIFVLNSEGVAGARERIRQFNRAFEEAYKKQASWTVLDPEAREDLRADLTARIAEPYRLFYDHCRPVLRRDRDSMGIFLFTPEDVAHYLADLYEPENSDASALSSVSGSGTTSPRSPARRSSVTNRSIWRTAIRRFLGHPGRPDAAA